MERITNLLALLLIGCAFSAGGGGLRLTAPDTAESGKPIAVNLITSVASGRIQGRWKDMRMYYRLAGEPEYQVLTPTRHIPQDDKHELYEFVIPPYPKGTKGEIEFYFTFVFDGRSHKREGQKKIEVTP